MTTGVLSAFLPVNGLVLIETQTASSSATIDFDSGIGSTYNSYILEGLGIKPATDDVELYLRVSQDAGSNWLAADYTGGVTGFELGGVQSANASKANSAAALLTLAGGNASTFGVGNSTGECASFRLHVARPAASALFKLLTWESAWVAASGTMYRGVGGGRYTANANAIDGLRVLFESGNIAAGVFNLYGVKG